MTETITIDGLPEGYSISSVNSVLYLSLYDPDGHYVFSMSKRYKLATIEKKFISEAEQHAAKTYRHRRTKAEKTFCEGFTTEQLEAVTMAKMLALIKRMDDLIDGFTKLTDEEVVTLALDVQTLTRKLEGTEVLP